MSDSTFIFERIKLHALDDQIPSPGCFNGNRIAVGEFLEDIYVASHNNIYRVQPSLVREADIESPQPDMGDNYIPIHQSSCSMEVLSVDSIHKEEICNLYFKKDASSHSNILYSIDMKGYVNMRIENDKETHHIQLNNAKTKIENQIWAGLDICPSDSTKLITATHLSKLVTLYDNDRVVRTIRTILNPTQVKFVDENLVAITEYNTLTLIDVRQKDSLSVVKRMQPYSGPLYAMHVQGSLIGVGGFNRSVAVFDKRKMAVVSHWSSSLKYEITRFLFSSLDPTLCYVSGLDSEILCGRWDGSSNLSHFDGPRVESRWVGITQHVSTDTVLGFTEQGYCYVLRNGVKLLSLPKNK